MIIKPNIALENNLFLIKNESTTICFLLLGKNYLSYVLTNSDKTKIYSIRHYYTANQVIGKSDFNSILSDSNLEKVSHFHVAVDTLKSTIVPKSLFEKEMAFNMLATLVEIDNEESVETQLLPHDMVSLFTLKNATMQFLSSKLKNVTFYDASASLLISYPLHIIHEHKFSFFLAVRDEFCILSIYKKHELIQHQIMEYSSIYDVLYVIANEINVRKIDSEAIGIQLHGESDKVEEFGNLLKKYYSYVRYCTRIKDLQYPDTLYAKPAHYFFNLFSLISCEL